jgi:hypothetical protein
LFVDDGGRFFAMLRRRARSSLRRFESLTPGGDVDDDLRFPFVRLFTEFVADSERRRLREVEWLLTDESSYFGRCGRFFLQSNLVESMKTMRRMEERTWIGRVRRRWTNRHPRCAVAFSCAIDSHRRNGAIGRCSGHTSVALQPFYSPKTFSHFKQFLVSVL